jgi:hypothetical protein
MSIIATYNGVNVIGWPCDTTSGVTKPSSVEWGAQEVVSANVSPFTGQTQAYDFMASWWEATVSLPPMTRLGADSWSSFLMECRGQSNYFQLGDPKATAPKGTPTGTPLINGASQTGYYLTTDGWTPSASNLLLPGDFISIAVPGVTGSTCYRLYKVMDAVNSNGSGQVSIHIWPPLRDQPADNTPVVTSSCKGLFRLASNTNKWSTNAGNYGVTAFRIREAI